MFNRERLGAMEPLDRFYRHNRKSTGFTLPSQPREILTADKKSHLSSTGFNYRPHVRCS